MPMTREGENGNRHTLPDPECEERDADQHDAGQEGWAESLRAGERESPDRAEERSHPDRRIEVADAAVTEIEQLDGDDDDEDLDGAEDGRLGGEQHHHHAQGGVPCRAS